VTGQARSARLNINLRRAFSTLNPPSSNHTSHGAHLEWKRWKRWKGIGTRNTSSALLEGRRPTRLVARRGLPRYFAPGRPITAGFKDPGLLPRRPRLAASWLLLRWHCWSRMLAALVGLAGLALSLPSLPLLPCPGLPLALTHHHRERLQSPRIHFARPPPPPSPSSPPHSSSTSSFSNFAITKTHLTPRHARCLTLAGTVLAEVSTHYPHPAARLAPHRLDSTRLDRLCLCFVLAQKLRLEPIPCPPVAQHAIELPAALQTPRIPFRKTICA
jgi:hypothetical protein